MGMDEKNSCLTAAELGKTRVFSTLVVVAFVRGKRDDQPSGVYLRMLSLLMSAR